MLILDKVSNKQLCMPGLYVLGLKVSSFSQTISSFQCRQHCQENALCTNWMFDGDWNYCDLFSSVTSSRPGFQTNFLSGSRLCELSTDNGNIKSIFLYS